MACPFGVLTYAPLAAAPDKAAVALKCDQCPDREKVGKVPACVRACKVGALTYGDWPAAQEDRGRAIARAFFAALPAAEDEARAAPPAIRLWRQLG
jgi:carbon-monoxide dehydrogenase iron sulfur subunit